MSKENLKKFYRNTWESMSQKNRIALFEKVSKLQFSKDYSEEYYENVTIPERSTKDSAGYDFVIPFDCIIKPGDSVKIPTGIRCYMAPNYVLCIFPRSGLGFKYRCQLDNTVGIIDADYYNSDNEGHIMIKITNDGKEGKDIVLKAGDRFAQGIFLQYGITLDDNANDIRNGGFASTDGKK